MDIKGIIIKQLLSDLIITPVDPNATYFLIGASALGDGKGGFYYWDSTAIDAEETTYMNVIKSTLIDTGRFKRVFSRAIPLPHGILSIAGGVKSFYTTSSYLTDANGECSVNLTMDNTTTGVAIFSEIWWNSSRAIPPTTSTILANDTVVGIAKTQSADKKTTTHVFTRGNSQTAILNITISGLRPAASGVSVQFKVEGI